MCILFIIYMTADQELQCKEITSSFDSYSKNLMMLKVFFTSFFDILTNYIIICQYLSN